MTNIEAIESMMDDDMTEAAREGAFYAETDWQWASKSQCSMAQHCEVSWTFIVGTVCPEWNNEQARMSFFIGYEDRATELSDAGEAGYEALAEAGTVADTEGWILQSEPWVENASGSERALRAVRAAWAGAAAWQARAASGEQSAIIRAGEALIRSGTADECMPGSRYVTGADAYTH